MKHVTQEERLDYLVEEFKTDSGEYRNIETPKDTEGKRRVLRSLMNIRMPRNISSDVLRVQDEYLKGRSEEKESLHYQIYRKSGTVFPSGRAISQGLPWTRS